jgi:nitroimidazol reductase NimA-like FMN-containing flavoprotein (pyridoxamine 5'-phosphate oxidase superfamily)
MSTDAELEGFDVLAKAECAVLLTRGCVGRVGFVVGGRPQVLPVNYAADDTGVVVFRTSANSSLMAIAMQAVVFEVDGLDEAHRAGWSVCVHGTARSPSATTPSPSVCAAWRLSRGHPVTANVGSPSHQKRSLVGDSRCRGSPRGSVAGIRASRRELCVDRRWTRRRAADGEPAR